MDNWYDTQYPHDSLTAKYIRVDLDSLSAEDRETVFTAVEETKGVLGSEPTKQWLFLSENPDQWRGPDAPWPAKWKDRSHPEGGLPRNVWFGLHWAKPEQIIELAQLRRIPARRLFVFTTWGPGLLDEAKLDFTAWRCSNCGVRGEYPRPQDCPNTRICGTDTLQPQIHWIIGDVTISKEYGIKVWSKHTQERPE